MTKVSEKLDTIEQNVMSELKDFQRATVERIYELFKEQYRHNRVLVSDEVGLGKTLVARGVIAKFAQIRKAEGDDLVKVVYICSNAAIAEQNLSKLKITGEIKAERADSSRLSMQHLNIFNQENDPELKDSYIQLIPLTPETSFRMTSGAGTSDERALMYAILKRMQEFKPYEYELVSLLRDNAPKAWDGWCRDWYENKVQKCNDKSHGDYLNYMITHVSEELVVDSGDGSLLSMIIRYFESKKNKSTTGIRANDLIAKLRVAFAKVSLGKLEPDIVIMDEFQRFKFLLKADPESDLGLLVNRFFEAPDLRILLLSATPYKMYSTLEEIDETHIDEHYSEFLDVMEFLKNDEGAYDSFKTVWNNYSVCIRELSEGDISVLAVTKSKAEDSLYESVCRTERITEHDTADMIDDSSVKTTVDVSEADIKSYVQAQQVLKEIGASFNTPIDYIKSCPYIMSFMNDYQLKKKVEKYFYDHPDEVGKIYKDSLWIGRQKLNKYQKLPYGNARLQELVSKAIPSGAEKLLWIPPSKPYYELGGPFREFDDFTKTIVFSSWEMVPRMIAGMLSYEAERLTVGSMSRTNDSDERYFSQDKIRRLSFTQYPDGRPRRMTLLSLVYPYDSLADMYDPIDCMNRGLTERQIEKEIQYSIQSKLAAFPEPKERSRDYTKWYYLAPMLLDKEENVRNWFNDAKQKAGDTEESDKETEKAYKAHIATLEQYYNDAINGNNDFGKRPDDLVDVLTDMVMASPAVCVKRAFNTYTKGQIKYSDYWATEVALAFLRKMDNRESRAAIDVSFRRLSDDFYWQNQLKYNKWGNIQAVIDEYMHLLINSNADIDASMLEQAKNDFIDSMRIRATAYPIDTYQKFKVRVTGEGNEIATSMRTHYAVAFTKGQSRESDTDRKRTVRNAFNSPFRPFVLASTSIGQEGLDFHNYCRRIVHWNLPSNPIDLEQREGRINRYKCLAIRQNIAKRYGGIHFKQDVWKEMFKEAKVQEKAKATGASDLLPFWGLTDEPDMIKIERIVPMYPFSRDEIQYDRLIKILSLYRLTLGQARQEELLEYLMDKQSNIKDLQKLFINLSPYYRNKEVD